ncbi:MAG TPA: hypothetical protein VG370_06250 [Chloroflexota bacterium]|nr:hypothetical protein [Chloroflexota bacterium]
MSRPTAALEDGAGLVTGPATTHGLASLFGQEGLLVDEFESDPAGEANLIALLPGQGGGRSLIVQAYVGGALDDRAAGGGMLALVRALRRSGTRLRGDLLLHVATLEGAAAAHARGYRADGAVVLSAHADNLTVGHLGHLSLELIVYGQPAPAAREWFGISAIAKTRYLLGTLGVRVVTTRIAGGEWLGNVPNKCVVDCYAVVERPDTLHAARRAIEQAVDAAARADPWLANRPPRVRWTGVALEPFAGDDRSELVGLVQRCYSSALGAAVQPSITRAGVPLASAAALADQTVAIRFDASSGAGVPKVLAATVVEWCGRVD